MQKRANPHKNDIQTIDAEDIFSTLSPNDHVVHYLMAIQKIMAKHSKAKK